MNRLSFVSAAFWALFTSGLQAADYRPPAESAAALKAIDFAAAVPLNEAYRRNFTRCDGLLNGAVGKDTFKGVALHKPYLCSTDPSYVKTLLKLQDGGVLWESKMALDLDGSWASWSGIKWKKPDGSVQSTTDLCGTSMKWKSHTGSDCAHPEAQVDSDKFPFIVMPTASLTSKFGSTTEGFGKEFGEITGLKMRDMGVVVYKGKWSPVFIADGGPFMRLGEGSARLFENLGQSRCQKWDAAGTRCIGLGNQLYPYKNFGISSKVVFVVYPGSGKATMTPETAMAEICGFAKAKLGLSGAAGCP